MARNQPGTKKPDTTPTEDDEDLPPVTGINGDDDDEEDDDDEDGEADGDDSEDGGATDTGRLTKAVEFRANDLLNAVSETASAAVTAAMAPVLAELEATRADNKQLRSHVIQLTKAVNLGNGTLGEINTNQQALVKSMGDFGTTTELLKGAALTLEEAATGTALAGGSRITNGTPPGQTLLKAAVLAPGTEDEAAGSGNGFTPRTTGGDLSPEQIAELPTLLQKGMSLESFRGEKVDGFGKLVEENNRGVITAETFNRVKTSVATFRK